MSFFGLKPTFFRNGTSFSLHSSYLRIQTSTTRVRLSYSPEPAGQTGFVWQLFLLNCSIVLNLINISWNLHQTKCCFHSIFFLHLEWHCEYVTLIGWWATRVHGRLANGDTCGSLFNSENTAEITSTWVFNIPFSSPLQAPVDCWVIHLVDQNNQVFDSSRFSQHGMLSCLPTFLKTSLKLAFSSRDYLQENKYPHQDSSGFHIVL